MKIQFKRNRFSLEKTSKNNDNPTRKQPKHVPAAETCEWDSKLFLFKSITQYRFLNLLTNRSSCCPDLSIKVTPNAVIGICTKSLKLLKSIKQNQRLEFHEKSQEPEPQPLPRSQHYPKTLSQTKYSSIQLPNSLSTLG